MSKVRAQDAEEPSVIAVVCSDLHLSHTPPLARSEEFSWYNAMRRNLQQLQDIASKYEVPTLCSGDIFHKWDNPSELVNFAMNELPQPFYAVPGQHDLPFHQTRDIWKTSYWTLVQSGTIHHVESSKPHLVLPNLLLHGFGWGEEMQDAKERCEHDVINVAMIHRYIGKKGFRYPGAPAHVMDTVLQKELQGYDVAVFGDNHLGFLSHFKKLTIFNCGGFMRRSSDEANRIPMFGVLLSSGNVLPVFLDTSGEKLLTREPSESSEVPSGMEEMLDALSGESQTANFQETLCRMASSDKFSKGVRSYLAHVLERLP